ncbi:DNA packaging protein FI, partial [Escherichia coli TA271]
MRSCPYNWRNHGPSGPIFLSVEESMTKDELIARLQVLGEQLNRDVSLTGTKENWCSVWQSWKRSL